MSHAIICDGCGRRIVNAGSEITIQTPGRRGPEERHFCPDLDGRTVGCGRKILSALEKAIRATGEAARS